MVAEAIQAALLAPEGNVGEIAGSTMLQLAADRGLDTTSSRIYDSVTHHACIADLMSAGLRKPEQSPWLLPDPVQNWTSSSLMAPDGNSLRRLVLVSHWTAERHYAECRSWFSLGEIAAYELPMQMVVLVLGQERDGLRHGPWSQGFLHPQNHQLRFRKKSRSSSEVFSEKWEKINREDHAEISRETWLEAMLRDDVLDEVCFRIDIPIPNPRILTHIRDLGRRKMDHLMGLKHKPDPNLSSCDWPVPCQFLRCCHSIPEREPSEKNGFLQVLSEQKQLKT
jgi:hypothetical protein